MLNGERAIRAYRASRFAEKGWLRAYDLYNGQHVDVVLMGQLRADWEARRNASI